MTEIRNALIEDTKLGEDHGLLTATLYLSGEGWGCCYGGYVLGTWHREHSENYGTGALVELMKTVGVEKWEDLKGKLVRVRNDGFVGRIDAVGNILEDKWFSFREYFAHVEEIEGES